MATPPEPPPDSAPSSAPTADRDDLDRDEDSADELTPTRRIDQFRRTAAGGALAAGLLGVRDALEGRPEREETAIVVDAPQSQLESNFDVMLDPDRPGHGVVIVHRPLPDDD